MSRPRLEDRLRERVAARRKLLIPYVMAGQSEDWLETVQAIADAGADAIEIGLPFSDPIMDGPVIQEAAVLSLERGTTPQSVLNDLGRLELDTPLVVMTYFNLVYRAGLDRFAGRLQEVGVTGCIIPDLSLEEFSAWEKAAERVGIDPVLLVAPSTSNERAKAICERSKGFLYAVGRMGVTGERDDASLEVDAVVSKVRPFTTLPVCVGVGVSTPEQAAAVVRVADGAIVGSALVRRLLEGGGPEGAATFIRELRSALDGVTIDG
ncbi:MAG: tryptophan synthase subunit alpha [Actinomycetota bacterium]